MSAGADAMDIGTGIGLGIGAGSPDAPLGLERYRRQIVLPELGLDGQRRLEAGRVLVVGVGALGSAAALYLAAAGVGTIGLVDDDRVEEHNLHRQVLYADGDVGRAKTEVAARELRARNGAVRVVEHPVRLTPDNALELVDAYDVVVDGSDNFPTRYLVNDAAVLARRPLVEAAILRFEGQLAVFTPGGGCYRCLFPAPPPPGSVPSCAEAGVIGALAGVFGSMQALEAVKLLAGIGPRAAGKFVVYDALALEWQTVRVGRNAACPVCGDRPTLTRLLADYDAFCGLDPTASSAPVVAPDEAARWLARGEAVAIDVRSPAEHARGHIAGAAAIGSGDASFVDRAQALAHGRRAVCVCAVGERSRTAAVALRAAGIEAYSLDGGMLAWAAAGLPWETTAEAAHRADEANDANDANNSQATGDGAAFA